MAKVVKVNTGEMMEKMKAVSEALLAQEEFMQLRMMVDEFSQDNEATDQFEAFDQLQRALHQKEHQGLQLTEDEIREYEQEEARLYRNDKIRRFLFAQEQFSKIHEIASQFIVKTVELGKVPSISDIKVDRSCGCGGGGCGCGGH